MFYDKIENEFIRDEVLKEGIWRITRRPFVINKWSQNLNLNQGTIYDPNLDESLWYSPRLLTIKSLSYVASALKKSLYMDKVTEERRLIVYAKVCVVINVKDGFLDEFELEMPNSDVNIVRVEYSWRPIACKWCKSFGHDKKHCMQAPKESSKKKKMIERMRKKRKERRRNGKQFKEGKRLFPRI